MTNNSSLDKLLDQTLTPDFKIEYLDTRISPQEYLLSNLTRIGRICVANKNYTPSIVMLDDTGKLICNHQFQITFLDKVVATNPPKVNVHIDIITDYNAARKLYYTVVEDTDVTAAPSGGVGYVQHQIPFSEIPVAQHHQVVDYIVSDPNWLTKYPKGVVTNTWVHAVNFNTNRWEITFL